jgi:hypothetical protein
MNGSHMPSYGWIRYFIGHIRLGLVPDSTREAEIRKLAAEAKQSSNPDDRLRGLLHCTDWACSYLKEAPDKPAWEAFCQEMLSAYSREKEAQNR